MTATLDILINEPVATIAPGIYGHFAEHLGNCIEGGIWRNGQMAENVVNALRRVSPPVVRWPGGCFADDYHWQDGIGPAERRPRRINIHWGEVVEDNAFGTHEFIHFCRHIGAEPYFCGNVGSGSPQELRDWVEYCNFPGGTTLSDLRAANGSSDPFGVRYWGVGNENWGCGGMMTPEEYATHYRRFSTYLRDLGGTHSYLVACGPADNDLDWTRRFFAQLYAAPRFRRGNRIHGYAAHYYTNNRDHGAGTATEYTDAQWYELLRRAQAMETLVVEQRAAMDEVDPERRIDLIVDEWGTWHPPTPGRNPRFLWQQNTLRDALVAALTLDIFNRHADKVAMANIAQTVNVLQALILTEGDRVLLTPTFHVYELYKVHQRAQAVRLACSAPEITFEHNGESRQLFGLAGSASIQGRTLALTVVNPQLDTPVEATINLRGGQVSGPMEETVLTHTDIHAHNTFDVPETVVPAPARTLPLGGDSFTHTFAPQSVTRLLVPLG
ncbi:MAG: alpha-L-arabinofuranosidase C-terminal domain-containing protein [Thermomicrobiales bacterium]